MNGEHSKFVVIVVTWTLKIKNFKLKHFYSKEKGRARLKDLLVYLYVYYLIYINNQLKRNERRFVTTMRILRHIYDNTRLIRVLNSKN